eukprot:m.42325 g.42325  ORF g.42325 m.42325 type:complete len:3409 (+) comp8311_c0_seq1:244-10470(+)
MDRDTVPRRLPARGQQHLREVTNEQWVSPSKGERMPPGTPTKRTPLVTTVSSPAFFRSLTPTVASDKSPPRQAAVRKRELSRLELETELQDTHTALEKAEKDLIEAATHGMRLLEENERLNNDMRQQDCKSAEQEHQLRLEIDRATSEQKITQQMLELSNEKIRTLEHKCALVLEQAQTYEDEIKELQTKLSEQEASSAKLLLANKSEEASTADLLREVDELHQEVTRLSSLAEHQEKVIQGCIRESQQLSGTVTAASTREAAALDTVSALQKENDRLQQDLDAQTLEWPARLRDEETKRAAAEAECAALEGRLEATVRHYEDKLQQIDDVPTRDVSPDEITFPNSPRKHTASTLDGELERATIPDSEHIAIVGRLQAQVDAAKYEVAQLTVDLAAQESESKDQASTIAGLRSALDEARADLDDRTTEVERLQSRVGDVVLKLRERTELAEKAHAAELEKLKLEKNLGEVAEELKEYAEYTATLEHELAAANSQGANLVQTIADLTQSKIKSPREGSSPMKVVIDDTTTLLDGFIRELSGVESELKKARKEVEERKSNEEKLRTDLVETEFKLSDAIVRESEANTAIEKCEAKLIEVEEQHISSMKTLASRNEECEELNSKLDDAASLFSRIQKDLVAAKGQISESQSEASALRDEVKELRNELSLAKTATSRAENIVIELSQKVDELKCESAEASHRADSLSTQLAEAKADAETEAASQVQIRLQFEDDVRSVSLRLSEVQAELERSRCSESQSAETVRRLRQEVQELGLSADGLRLSLEGTEANLNLAKQEIQILQEQSEAVDAERNAHQAMCMRLESELQQCQIAAKVAKDEATSRGQELAVMSNAISEGKVMISELEERLATTSNHLSQTQKKLEEQEHSSEFAELRSGDIIRSLTCEVEQQKATATQLEEQLSTAMQSVEVYEKRLAELKTKHDVACQDLARRTEELCAQETLTKERNVELSALRDTIHRVHLELSSANESLLSREKTIEDARSACTSLQQELHNAKSSALHEQSEKEQLKQHFLQMQGELDEVRQGKSVAEQEIKVLTEEVSSLRQDAENQKTRLNKKVAEYSSVCEERDVVNSQITDLTSQLTTIQALKAEKESQLEEALQSCAEHETIVSTTQDRVEDLEEKLAQSESCVSSLNATVVELTANVEAARAEQSEWEAAARTATASLESASTQLEEHVLTHENLLQAAISERDTAVQLSESCREQIRTLEDKLQCLTATGREQEQTISDLKHELANATNIISQLQSEIHEAELRTEHLSATEANFQAECSDLKQKVADALAESTRIKSLLANEERKKSILQDRCDEFERARDNILHQYQSARRTITELEDELDARASEVASRSIDIAAHVDENRELKDNLEKADRLKGEAEIAAMDLQTKLERYTSELHATKAQQEALSIALEAANTEGSAVAQRLEVLLGENNSLTTDLESANSRCNDLDIELTKSREHVSELQARVSTTEDESQCLSEALATTTAELSAATAQLESLRQENDSLAMQIVDATKASEILMTSATQSAELRCTELTEERDDVLREHEELTKRFEEASEMVVNMSENLGAEQAKAHSLEEELAAAHVLCGEMQSALDDTVAKAQSLEDCLASHSSEYDAQSQDLQVQKELIAAMQEDAAEHQKHTRMLEVALLEVQVKSDALAERLDQKQRECDDLGTRLFSTESGLESLSVQMKETIQFAESLSQQLSLAATTRATLEKELELQTEAASQAAAKLEKAQQRLDEVNSVNVVAADDAASLSEALSTTTAELAQQSAILEETKASLVQSLASVSEERHRAKTLAEQLDEERAWVKELEQRSVEMEQQHQDAIAGVISQYEARSKEAQCSMEASLQVVLADLANRTYQLDTSTEQCAQLTACVSELHTKLAEATLSSVNETARARDLEKVIAILEQQHMDAVKKLSLERSEASNLRTFFESELTDVRDELAARCKKLHDVTTSFDELKMTVADLEDKLAQSEVTNAAQMHKFQEFQNQTVDSKQEHEDALTRLLQQLRRVTDEAAKTQSSLEYSITEANRELAIRTTELEASCSQRSALETKVSELNDKIFVLQQSSEIEMSRVLHERDTANSEALNSRADLETTKADLATSKLRCAELTATVAELERKLTGLTQELDGKVSELDSLAKKSVRDAAQHSEVIVRFTTERDARDVTLSEVQGQLAAQTAELENLSSKSAASASEISALQTEIVSVRAEASNYRQNLVESTSHCEALAVELGELNTKLADMVTKNADLTEEFEFHTRKTQQDHSDAIRRLVDDHMLALQTATQERDDLKSSLNELQDTLAAVEATCNGQSGKIRELSQELKTSRAEAAQIRTSVTEELDSTRAELAERNTAYSQMVTRCDELTSSIRQLEIEILTASSMGESQEKRVLELENQILESQNQHEQVVAQIVNEHANAIATASQAQAVLESSLERSQADLAIRTTELKICNDRCKSMGATVSELETLLSSTRETTAAHIEDLATEIHDLTMKHTTAVAEHHHAQESTLKVQRAEQERLKQKLEAVTDDLNKMTREVEATTLSCHELTIAKSDLERELADISESNEKRATWIEELLVRLEESQNEKHAIVSELKKKQDETTAASEEQKSMASNESLANWVSELQQEALDTRQQHLDALTSLAVERDDAAASAKSTRETLETARNKIGDLLEELSTKSSELKAVTQNCDQLTTVISKLSEEVSGMSVVNDAQKVQIAELQASLFEAQALQSEMQERHVAELEHAVLDYHNVSAKASIKISALESEITTSSAALATKTDELNQVSTRCDELTSTLHTLQDRLITAEDIYQSDTTKLRLERDNAISGAKLRQDSLESTLAMILGELTTRTQEVETTRALCTELRWQMTTHQATQTAQSARITDLSSQLESRSAEIKEMEDTHRDKISDLLQMHDENEAASNEDLLQLEAALQQTRTELMSRSSDVQLFSARCEELELALAHRDRALTEAVECNEANNARLAKVQAQLKDVIAARDSQIDTLRNSITTQATQLEESTTRCSDLEVVLADCAAQLRTVKEFNQCLLSQIHEAETHLADVEQNRIESVAEQMQLRRNSEISAAKKQSSLEESLMTSRAQVDQLVSELNFAHSVTKSLEDKVSKSTFRVEELSRELSGQCQALAEISAKHEESELAAATREQELTTLGNKYQALSRECAKYKSNWERCETQVTAEREGAAALQQSLQQLDSELGETQAELRQVQALLHRAEDDVGLLASALAAANGEADAVKDEFAVHATSAQKKIVELAHASQKNALRIEALKAERSFHKSKCEDLKSVLSQSEHQALAQREVDAAAEFDRQSFILDRKSHYNRRHASVGTEIVDLHPLNVLRWRMRTMGGGVETAGLRAITTASQPSPEQRRCRELWGAFFCRPMPPLPPIEESQK